MTLFPVVIKENLLCKVKMKGDDKVYWRKGYRKYHITKKEWIFPPTNWNNIIMYTFTTSIYHYHDHISYENKQ